MKIRYRIALLVGTTLVLSAQAALASQKGPTIVPISSRIVSVKTYAELGAEWWQWALQAGSGSPNPVEDVTGDNCAVGQRGPVWFLAGSSFSANPGIAERVCDKIPAGKALFFPLINRAFFAFLNDPPERRTPEFIRSRLNCTNIRDLSLHVNGRPVPRRQERLRRFETTGEESPLFDVQLPVDNIFGVTEVDATDLLLSPSAHQGYYVYLRPLTPGEYIVAWTAAWDCDSGDGFEELSENVRYHITVRAEDAND